jgi:hypothetical protein
MLRSKFLSQNKRLQDCLINDASHVQLGDKGDHVHIIQHALFLIESVAISKDEMATHSFGKTTQAAVLSYKSRRKIINTSYQKNADAIVGKMTIKSLDEEIAFLEEDGLCEDSKSVGLRPFKKQTFFR